MLAATMIVMMLVPFLAGCASHDRREAGGRWGQQQEACQQLRSVSGMSTELTESITVGDSIDEPLNVCANDVAQ
ncbi:MAG: hypothetical protein M3305_15435 [Actinomycetota bacterium]|nr:hypothetical protein [Actinomycetota bacterium]